MSEIAFERSTGVEAAPAGSARPSLAVPVFGLVAGAAWVAAAAYTAFVPNVGMPVPYTGTFAVLLALFGGVVLALSLAAGAIPELAARVRHAAPWLVLLGASFGAWQFLTAKTGILPLPFFTSPQSLLEVFLDDWARLGESVLYSFLLLAQGYLVGALAGFLTGVSIGWSKIAAYWTHPILRFVGPLPATAWLPLSFFIFPSSGSASVFLIALATWFPVTVLTWSGIASVNRAYYDIARTLGANGRFLVLKVAVPAALPHVFVGLFMGLGASFSVLVVAEMLGVKAGIGWYLQWAQGWAAYANMYAALLVMALLCSGLTTLLFRVRDHVLAWQKGLVRW